jgi:glucan phosphorylase
MQIKKMSKEERENVVPKVVFFAGKAAPGCTCLCLHGHL